MATYEQLMNAARNADTAGDEQAAARLVQMAKAAQQPQADMSVLGRIKDNLIGTDDGVESFGEKDWHGHSWRRGGYGARYGGRSRNPCQFGATCHLGR